MDISNQDKDEATAFRDGHASEIQNFYANYMKENEQKDQHVLGFIKISCPHDPAGYEFIPIEDSGHESECTFRIIESCREGKIVVFLAWIKMFITIPKPLGNSS